MSRIDFLIDKSERLTAQIERWEAKPQTERRIAKIERQKRRLARTLSEIESIQERDRLEAELAQQAEDSLLPVDTFDVSITKDSVTGAILFNVDVYDSPFDDTFIGGEPLMMKIRGTGKHTPSGFSSFNSRRTLANGEYWDGLTRQTLINGGAFLGDIEEYPEVAVTIAKDTRDWPGNPMGDILAIQTFDMTEYVVEAV